MTLHWRNRNARQRLARAGAVCLPFGVTFGVLTAATPAAAATKPGKVKTHGHRLWIRSGPARTHQAAGALHNGAKAHITCQTTGEPVDGTYGTSALWDRVGKRGYVSDAYVYTGSDGRVAPWCGGKAPSGSPKQIARRLLPKYGWSAHSHFGCLDELWTKESGWNPRAQNPSGAYGIPQALPASKMASAGPDWRTNAATQIRWGGRRPAGTTRRRRRATGPAARPGRCARGGPGGRRSAATRPGPPRSPRTRPAGR